MDASASGDLWASVAVLVGVWLAALVTPGPDFLATVNAALTGSRRAGVLVGVGVGIGMAVWATASLLGLGLLLRTSELLYGAVRLAGAAYLVYLGARLLWSARRRHDEADLGAAPLSDRGALGHGLLTNLSNPKAAALFGSLLAALTPPEAPLWFDVSLVLFMAGSAIAWYVAVACVMASGPVARAYRSAARAIAALTGALFVGLGVRLAADR